MYILMFHLFLLSNRVLTFRNRFTILIYNKLSHFEETTNDMNYFEELMNNKTDDN